MSTVIESVTMKITETEDGVEACFEVHEARICGKFTIEAEPEKKAKLKLVFASTLTNIMKVYVGIIQSALRVMNKCMLNPDCKELLKPQ
jgi:hypothetical protein